MTKSERAEAEALAKLVGLEWVDSNLSDEDLIDLLSELIGDIY